MRQTFVIAFVLFPDAFRLSLRDQPGQSFTIEYATEEEGLVGISRTVAVRAGSCKYSNQASLSTNMVGKETRSCSPLGTGSRAKPSPDSTMQVLELFPVPQHEDHGTLRDLQRPGDIRKTFACAIDQLCHPGISQQRRHLHTAPYASTGPIIRKLAYAVGSEEYATNDRKTVQY